MNLKSGNGTYFRPATVMVSTVKLPISVDGCMYETCLFTKSDSEVIDRYETLSSAISGHKKYSNEYGVV